jgi:hypothetical protein
MRSAKVMAKALSAGFHRVTHRACPRPLGSSDRTTRYSVLSGGLLGGEVALGVHGAPVAGVQGLDGVGRAEDLADLDVVVQERDELFPGVARHSLGMAG